MGGKHFLRPLRRHERRCGTGHYQRLRLPRERGTAFGWYHLMVGIAAIPAGLLFGRSGSFRVRPRRSFLREDWRR